MKPLIVPSSIRRRLDILLVMGEIYYFEKEKFRSVCTLDGIQKGKIYQFMKCLENIILSVVLYGYETWSLTLRDERRFRVFENRVLRRLFWPKRDGVTGEEEKTA